LALAVAQEPDLEVVGEAGTAEHALALAAQLAPDLAVLDMLLPDLSGLSLASELVNRHPAMRILGLSVVDEPGLVADLLRAGASGHALKTQPTSEIVEAIRHALAGLRYLAPTMSRDAVDAALHGNGTRPLAQLTRREREVFELLIRGFSNHEIASQLFISRRTVEAHRQRIAKKLSAHSVVELQRIAARYGGLAP
jgi:DNA-binding NarL/FixJ family response regulator